jgi:hypothetical protein
MAEITFLCCPKKLEVDISNINVVISIEEFEDTKGVIRIRKSKKHRPKNGQKKKDKKTHNDLQNIHIKLEIE